MKNRRVISVCLMACAALIGGLLFTTTTAADAKLGVSFTTIWNHIKPKADKRYVKKVDRNKIVRVASGSVDDATVDVPGTSVDLMTTQIKAPSRGFLVVVANGVYSVTPTPIIHCGVGLDADRTYASGYHSSTAASATGTWGQCSVNPIFKVAKGAHSVTYAAHNDGSGSASFRGGQLTVQFIPYNGKGKVPAVPKLPAHHGRDIARR